MQRKPWAETRAATISGPPERTEARAMQGSRSESVGGLGSLELALRGLASFDSLSVDPGEGQLDAVEEGSSQELFEKGGQF